MMSTGGEGVGALTSEMGSESKQRGDIGQESIWAALLATAVVRLRKKGDVSSPLRALCDSGSQTNLISAHAVKQLEWSTERCHARFNGINGAAGQPHTQKIVCELLSRFNDEPIATIELVVAPHLADIWLPHSPVPKHMVPEVAKNRLADPKLCTPAPFELLLGAGVWAIAISEGNRVNKSGIVLQPSRLGWLMFGGGIQTREELISACAIEASEGQSLEGILRKFWELEENSVNHLRTAAQEKCEEIFMQTHCRTHDGRYQVTIPLREDVDDLGSSRVAALRRFHQLERRFERDSELRKKYVEGIDEMLRNDQIRLVDRQPKGWCYHIPHHPVLKKFRIVFDASCRTDKNISLKSSNSRRKVARGLRSVDYAISL